MRIHSFLIFSFVFPISFFLASCGGGDTAPPEDVTGLTLSAYGGSASLSWTEPTTPEFNGVMIRRALGAAPPVDRYDGNLVAILPLGTATLLDTATAAGNQYAYRVLSVGLDGAMSTGITANLTITVGGSVDTSFGAGGPTPGAVDVVDIGGATLDENGQNLSVDSQGRFYVAGYFDSTVANALLMRFTSTGVLDTTFNPSGPAPGMVTKTGIGGGTWDLFQDVKVDAQNRPVVVGGTHNAGEIRMCLVARFNTDGSLDTTFNSAGASPGYVMEPMGNTASTDICRRLTIAPSGKIIVGGLNLDVATGAATVLRLNADGTHDTTFGAGAGWIRYSGSGTILDLWDVDVDSGGNIFTVTPGNPVAGFTGAAIMKFLPDGTPDPAWDNEGTVGLVTLRSGGIDSAMGVVIDAQDRVVVAGSENSMPAVWRVTANGLLDSSFGAEGPTFASDGLRTGGYVFSPPGATGGKFWLLKPDSKGNYIAAGWVSFDSSVTTNLLSCRFSASGVPDTTYGEGGCLANPTGANEVLLGGDMDAQDRLLYTGKVFNGVDWDIRIGAVLP